MKHLCKLIIIVLIVSCSSRSNKYNTNYNNLARCITNIDNVDDFSVSFTEDGHTMIYSKDSIGNYIVYYVKYDDNAGKYGYDRIKDKVVRLEMDSSLKVLYSFVTIYGGAFCDVNSDMKYTVFYFDEQMNYNTIEKIEVPLDTAQLTEKSIEKKIRHILSLLNVANRIAFLINEKNVKGWHNIVSALEPSQKILDYDIAFSDTVLDPNVKEHISRVKNTTKGLTQFYNLLRENNNYQNKNANQQ